MKQGRKSRDTDTFELGQGYGGSPRPGELTRGAAPEGGAAGAGWQHQRLCQDITSHVYPGRKDGLQTEARPVPPRPVPPAEGRAGPYLLPAPRLPPTVLTAALPPSKMAAAHQLLLPYPKWPPAVATASPTVPERKMAARAAATRGRERTRTAWTRDTGLGQWRTRGGKASLREGGEAGRELHFRAARRRFLPPGVEGAARAARARPVPLRRRRPSSVPRLCGASAGRRIPHPQPLVCEEGVEKPQVRRPSLRSLPPSAVSGLGRAAVP